MTPKEKAKELVGKMDLKMPVNIIPIPSTQANQLSCKLDLKGNYKNAKDCAKIAVEEMIVLCNIMDGGFSFEKEIQYYEQVKQEIENL